MKEGTNTISIEKLPANPMAGWSSILFGACVSQQLPCESFSCDGHRPHLASQMCDFDDPVHPIERLKKRWQTTRRDGRQIL
jgi:hypothetical protein